MAWTPDRSAAPWKIPCFGKDEKNEAERVGVEHVGKLGEEPDGFAPGCF